MLSTQNGKAPLAGTWATVVKRSASTVDNGALLRNLGAVCGIIIPIAVLVVLWSVIKARRKAKQERKAARDWRFAAYNTYTTPPPRPPRPGRSTWIWAKEVDDDIAAPPRSGTGWRDRTTRMSMSWLASPSPCPSVVSPFPSPCPLPSPSAFPMPPSSRLITPSGSVSRAESWKNSRLSVTSTMSRSSSQRKATDLRIQIPSAYSARRSSLSSISLSDHDDEQDAHLVSAGALIFTPTSSYAQYVYGLSLSSTVSVAENRVVRHAQTLEYELPQDENEGTAGRGLELDVPREVMPAAYNPNWKRF